MKINEQTKLEIQCFVYYFFKGSIGYSRGIYVDYLERVLANERLLFRCFELFATASQAADASTANFAAAEIVVRHLQALSAMTVREAADDAAEAQGNRSQLSAFWQEFLRLAACFCANSFPTPLQYDYLPELNGAGTFAVPPFATWTNVLEVDEHNQPLNADEALRRANERYTLMWDDSTGIEPFTEWELEQEIY